MKFSIFGEIFDFRWPLVTSGYARNECIPPEISFNFVGYLTYFEKFWFLTFNDL